MKIIFSESKPFYESYTFNYAIYAESEGSDLSEVYDSGFLPYTDNSDLQAQRFYLCRSLRIDLKNFKLNSENRRIMRKIEGQQLSRKKIRASTMVGNASFLAYCQKYAEARFHGRSLSEKRLKYILNWHPDTFLWLYQLNEQTAGYVLGIEKQGFVHYWYAFYNLELAEQVPLGKIIMTHFIQQANEEKTNYVYLGTCYHRRSLYKARDYKGIEFFDGNTWISDIKELKKRCQWDDQKEQTKKDWIKLKDLDLEK